MPVASWGATVGVATLCHETAQLHPRLRARPAPGSCARSRHRPHGQAGAAGLHLPRPTEGRLLGHVHLGLRLIERARRGPDRGASSRSSCTASRCTTTRAAARTAEAAVLYHANQLDAVAATRQGRLTAAAARARRQPRLGRRRLRRAADQPDARRAARCSCGRRSAASRRSRSPSRSAARARRAGRCCYAIGGVVRRHARAVRLLPRHARPGR